MSLVKFEEALWGAFVGLQQLLALLRKMLSRFPGGGDCEFSCSETGPAGEETCRRKRA